MIKRVFILCALVASVLMQSCDKDKIELTDLTVSNDNLTLPIGESVKISVTLTPTNVEGVTLEWTSSNTAVATVSNDGIVTITGIGTAVITVKSGSFSKTINVEGTIKSLTVTAPEGTKILLGAKFTLTATPDPADAQVTVVWSSENTAIATVSATGEVIVVGGGTTIIRATVGNISGTYTVVCEDMLDSAIGYWEFDDKSNIGKAIRGNALTPMGENIIWVEGPSEANQAIEVPLHEYFMADLSNGTPNGGPDDDPQQTDRAYNWSMMMDFRFPTTTGTYFYTQHGGVEQGDGDFFVMYRNDYVQAGKGNYIPIVMRDTATNATYTPWIRMVLTIEHGTFRMYCNGVEVAEDGGNYPLAQGVSKRFTIPIRDGALYIFSEPKGYVDGKPNFAASDDDRPFPCAAIAFWDKVLTSGQVKSLGEIAH
jgi:hypothetical protein